VRSDRPLTFLRLQLPDGWVSLPPGAYEVGRAPSCQIFLDGSKVSRLHARVVVGAGSATVEDLGSSNGVFVNGSRVPRGSHELRDGDTLVVGDFVIPVSYGSSAGASSIPRAFVADRPTLVGNNAPAAAAAPVTTKASALDLLATVAERVLAAGDAQRAEGILTGRLREILDGVRGGESCDPDTRDRAVRLALALANALRSTRWVDYTFDLLTATRSLPSEVQTREIDQAIERTGYSNPGPLGQYAKVVRDVPATLDKVRTLRQIDTWTMRTGGG
jgi:hypothetical protein